MRGAVFIILCAIVAGSAEAGPWGQDKRDTFARAALSSEHIDGAEAWRADLYGEYGLTDNWTLIAKAEAVRFPNARDFDASEARILVQRKLVDRRRFVVAAGGGVVSGAAIGGIEGCDSNGAEVRSSIGTSGVFANRAWYASADIAGRWHSDGCERHKLDFVFGLERDESSTISPQIYLEESNRGADSTAIQVEWIEHFTNFDLTFAYKFENGELFEQHASIIAISKRF